MFLANRAIGKLALQNEATSPALLYRGMSGKLRPSFVTLYPKPGANLGTLGNLADPALFSTTKDLSVAKGIVYGGEILFLLAKGSPEAQDEETRRAGFRSVYSPAPVQWISQFPDEEFLWPTNTALRPGWQLRGAT